MANIFILYGIILYLKLCKQIYLIKIFHYILQVQPNPKTIAQKNRCYF